MPLNVAAGAPTLFIRRAVYESSGINRATNFDDMLESETDEFRVEGDVIAIGPIYADGGSAINELITELEGLGLAYFDDFFELSGNWPVWLKLHASGR